MRPEGTSPPAQRPAPVSAPARVSFASVIASDIERLSAYYAGLFGLGEVASLRSELFRGLLAGGLVLGYSHADAAALLDLPPAAAHPGQQFLTFEVADDAEVERTTQEALRRGGTLLQAPHRTYYGAQQSVVLGPEGNPFRVNHLAIDELGDR